MRRNVSSTNSAIVSGKKTTEYVFGKTTYLVNSYFNTDKKRDINKIIEHLALKEADKNLI